MKKLHVLIKNVMKLVYKIVMKLVGEKAG